MLLSRYSSLDYVNKLPWKKGINLINKAIEKRNEQRDWEMWISIYPNMDKVNFIPFEKFRSKARAPIKQTKLSNEEIIEQANELMKFHQGKHEGVENY